MLRRTLIVTAAASFAAPALVARSSLGQNLRKVKMGSAFTTTTNAAFLMPALLKPEGIDLELVMFPSLVQRMQAVASGDVDIGNGGLSATMQLATKGLPMQILNSEEQPLAKSTISFVSPHVDDQTQTVLVKGQVRNPDATLRASQFVRARIVWKVTDGLLIPVTAVLRINGQFFAFVADNSEGKLVARQRPVKVGDIVGDSYVVLDGLAPGNRVVVSGAQRLADGAPITEAPPQAPPSPAPTR